ncbi:glycosyltransferase family 2 protein [Pseudoalteromonas sp. SYSU M81236]|uniref:glycosyltransferase family 2 protein n=1 Tax=Pseudoalteromonas sp. SYSU M81236 TaxID=3447014 RepID=UPI003F0E4E52
MIQLSIIIPYYKSRDGLFRLLNTIPEYNWLEIIIVNDHSDDLFFDDVTHSRAILIQQTKGKKWAGAARNTGLDLAKGKYLLFADSDDFFLENAFNIIEQEIKGTVDVVYFSPVSCFENGNNSKRHISYKELVLMYIETKEELIRYRFHVPWSKLIKNDFVKRNNIRFDEVIASNDVNFSLKTGVLAQSIDAYDTPIYCVVENDSSLTKTYTKEVSDSRFAALCRYNDFLIDRNDHNLCAMSGHIWDGRRFGVRYLLGRFKFCLKMKYKLFYDWKHVMRVLKRELNING